MSCARWPRSCSRTPRRSERRRRTSSDVHTPRHIAHTRTALHLGPYLHASLTSSPSLCWLGCRAARAGDEWWYVRLRRRRRLEGCVGRRGRAGPRLQRRAGAGAGAHEREGQREGEGDHQGGAVHQRAGAAVQRAQRARAGAGHHPRPHRLQHRTDRHQSATGSGRTRKGGRVQQKSHNTTRTQQRHTSALVPFVPTALLHQTKPRPIPSMYLLCTVCLSRCTRSSASSAWWCSSSSSSSHSSPGRRPSETAAQHHPQPTEKRVGGGQRIGRGSQTAPAAGRPRALEVACLYTPLDSLHHPGIGRMLPLLLRVRATACRCCCESLLDLCSSFFCLVLRLPPRFF